MALSAQKQSDIGAQYDPMRKRAQQLEASNLQGQRDQLDRNQARLGGAPSGAFIKQGQIAGDQSAQRLQTANEAVDAQQAQALNQARELQDQREFQTSERLGTQDWQGGQSALDRRLQKYGIDKSDSTQRYGIDTNKAIQVAGLTGEYNGTKTLAGKTYDASQVQQKLENSESIKANAINTFSQLVGIGYDPARLDGIFEAMGIYDLFPELKGLAGVSAPSAPPPSANAAPKPAAPTQTTTAGKFTAPR